MTFINKLWNEFLIGFCKVDFVCWEDDPNWLGWIFIGIIGYLIFGFILTLLSSLYSAIFNSEK